MLDCRFKLNEVEFSVERIGFKGRVGLVSGLVGFKSPQATL